jgi:A/G-specific adenine glycosylase
MYENEVVKKKIETRKADLTNNLIKWASKNSPEYPWRRTADPYNVMVSEMLLRRTRASSVPSVYEKFLKKFPTVSSLAKSSVEEIENIIQSLGMKSRSNKMKSAAKIIVEKYSGKIPSGEKELLEIVGRESRYTANAIRCFALNQKVPIFDVNVNRIFERIFSVDFGKAAHKKKDSWKLVSLVVPEKNIKQYNWALLDLGKAVCTPADPKCKICPLKTICDYGLKS